MIQKRIRQIIDYSKLSQNKFAAKIGVDSGAISRILKGGGFNHGVLENLVKEFPDISSRWLLTGKGEMLIESSSQFQKQELEEEIERLSKELEESQKDVIYLLRKLKELEAKENKNNTIKHTA